MYNNYYLFFLALISSFNLFAQNGHTEELMVVSTSGINVRTKPNITSEVIISVPFGAMIKRSNIKTNYNSDVRRDTIDNLPGYWEHVEYKGKYGFAFDANFTQSIQDQHTGFKKGQPQFVYEGPLNCGDYIFFNTNLKWYGLYHERTSKYQIKRVIPIIEPFYNTEEGYVNYRIKTKDTLISEFLFGLPYEISDTTTYQKNMPTVNYGNHESQFLFPGMSVTVGYNKITRTTYSIDVLGSVDSIAFINHRNSNSSPIIKNYQLRLTTYNNGDFQFQNLNKEIDIGWGHDFIEILFSGDLNSDGIPDFIIRTRERNVSELLLHLLISGESEGKLVERVAENYWGGCQ